MNATADGAYSTERDWWLRTLAVLQSPRAVFAALRNDRDDPGRALQEPITAIVLLACIAGVLASGVAGQLMDNREFDPLLVAVWAFIGGGFYGIAGYWAAGALVYAAVRLLGGRGSYRRARHVVGLAAAPLALSLLLLSPLRLAIYGDDLFRSGGADAGAGGDVFAGLALAFLAWALALVAVGLRAVYRWSWPRSLGAVALASLPVALLVAADDVADRLAKLASSSSGIA